MGSDGVVCGDIWEKVKGTVAEVAVPCLQVDRLYVDWLRLQPRLQRWRELWGYINAFPRARPVKLCVARDRPVQFMSASRPAPFVFEASAVVV